MCKKLKNVHFIVFNLFFAFLMVIAVQLIVLLWSNCPWFLGLTNLQWTAWTFPIISLLLCLYSDLFYYNFAKFRSRLKNIIHGVSLFVSVVLMILFLFYGGTPSPQGYFDITDFILLLSALQFFACMVFNVVIFIKHLAKPTKAGGS